MQNSNELIRTYLEDAIAAEKSFETQLEGFSKEGDDAEVQALFAQHASETRLQHEELTARLEALGGSPSSTKSFLAHFFNMTPKMAQIGHDKQERTTQNLMMAYAVENSEVAMYEALATSAEAAGDSQTAHLARRIQQQESQTAQKVWRMIAPCALRAFENITAGDRETEPEQLTTR
jgi:ferritin-like metal-binding protein YciE